MQRRVAETVSQASAAAVARKKVSDVVEVAEKKTDMSAIVAPVVNRKANAVMSAPKDEALAPRKTPLVVNTGEVIHDGIDLTFPSFLVRKE